MIRIKTSIHVLNDIWEVWQRDALEFTVGTHTTTIKDQFLYYYSSSCFHGTEDELKTALLIKIQDNIELLYQLYDLRTNISKIVQLDQYNKVTLQYTDNISTHANITASAANNNSTSTSSDEYIATDKSTDSSKVLSESGASQTNKLLNVKDVLTEVATKTDGDIKRYEPGSLSKPIQYQNFGIEQSTNEALNTTTSNTTQTANTTNRSSSLTTNRTASGTKLDETRQTVEYTTIDERLKMWRLELPKIRRKFWQSFSNLFTHEYR